MISPPFSPQLRSPAISVEVDRVPVDDGGRDEAEARCTEALVLESAIPNFALAMEEHGKPKRSPLC
jgi:hypothetical protein